MKTSTLSTNCVHLALARSALLLVSSLIACFGLLSDVQAVSPPPDGGYANGNTAEGNNALFHLTTGSKNTANGYLALFSNTSGQYNTATGAQALYSNSTGSSNTAVGFDALFYNTTGEFNTASGYLALFKNTTGIRNTANGFEALNNNTTGDHNTASGYQSLISNTAGGWNTATGYQALSSNTTGGVNTADGHGALFRNTVGGFNTATGAFAASNTTTGGANTAVGYVALESNTIGSQNTVLGFGAGRLITAGNTNTAIGYQSMTLNATGSHNVALGDEAGASITTANNVLAIGSVGGNVDNSCFIGNIRGVTTQNSDAIPVVIDSAGQLGTMSSSRRFKKEIKSMDKASEAILSLQPVTFHYKSDKTNTPQFGLIAEEVAKVNPTLVVHDKNGEIYTVRYDAVNAMLLNEFLKEHKAFLEEQRTVEELKKEVAALTAGLQKVSAQLEASKPAPQVVNNP